MDGVDMTREQFYLGLPTFETTPTSAAPGIEVFLRVYHNLAAEGVDGIVSIHIAEALSNVVNVAHLAAERAHGIPVTVIDSGQLTLGVGFQVLAAAEAAREGGSLEEVVARVARLIPRTHTIAALSMVEFLRRSGRLTQFQFQPLQKLGVVHTNALSKAEALYDHALPMLPPSLEPIYGYVTAVIGAHIGPGAVGFVCVSREQPPDRNSASIAPHEKTQRSI